MKAAITAVAGWVPDEKITNADLEKMVDTTDEWIRTRTGIRERRILRGENKGTSYMAARAVKLLLDKAGVDPGDVDAVICATITPDMPFPSTANFICDEIGISDIPGFDISAACSGFLYALETGNTFVKSGAYKKVVVVGADKMTGITDYSDRNNCIIFGDGAGAVLLEPSINGAGIVDTVLKSNPDGKDLIYLKTGGSRHPTTEATLASGDRYFFQDGRNVFKYAVTRMADVSEEIMKRNNLTGEDIRYLVPHQANKRIIEATANRMGIGMEKVTMNIEKYGNTTAATIPLCLWDWEKQLREGDNLVLAAFGAGFTWGATYLKWAYNPN